METFFQPIKEPIKEVVDTNIFEKVCLINQLPLPPDLTNKIMNIYKHEVLTPKYKKEQIELIQHMQYYMWLNKKINKKDKKTDTILQTIQEFDYYRPKPNYLK
tara:strand:+ start:9905 stop:10213 length:309 start_codon:yes stop_codon:yes gene_type:complete